MSIRETGKKYESKDRERFVICAWAKQKKGKTHLGLTAPEPIFLFNLDKGEEGVIEKFSDKEIYYEDYLVDDDMSTEKKADVLERFSKDYFNTLAQEDKGTIMIDSFTQVWDLVYSTKLEEILQDKKRDEALPFDYSDANEVAEGMIKAIYRTDLNMYLTERASEKYNEHGNKTGKFKPKGYKGLPYLVQVFGRIKTGDQRCYEIESNRFKDEVKGHEHKIYNPTFEKIGATAKEV